MSKNAVVTGGGSGVGRAVAIQLAEEGWEVAVLGRRQGAIDETAKRAANGHVFAIRCDISREDDVRAMVERVHGELGEVIVLVNSAGVNVPKRALVDLSVEDYRQVIDVNVTGAFLCVQAFLPEMRKAGKGTIVNVISDAGLTANRISGAAYIVSKFGLTGLSHTINVEERRNGIRACAIFPGEIDTPLLEKRPVVPDAEARKKMLQAEDVAACVMLAINLPDRAVVEQLVVRPR